MSKNVKKSAVKRVIAYIACLLVVIAAIGLIVRYTGIDDDIKDVLDSSFRIEFNGSEYRVNADNCVYLPESGQTRFVVKNGGNYTVKVVPNVDFEYEVDGTLISFKNAGQLTGYFIKNNDIYTEYFDINCTAGCYKINNFLNTMYGSNTSLKLPKLSDEEYYYKLVVISSNGQTVSMAVAQAPFIRIDAPENIVF